MNRELDGVYFRIKRDGKYDAYCFSDLTEEEMDSVLDGRSNEWLISLCKTLGSTIKRIGDQFDLTSSTVDDK